MKSALIKHFFPVSGARNAFICNKFRYKRMRHMRLKEGKNGCTYTVEEIHIELNLERRLEALGLTQGSQITILNNDKKGALTVRFRGTRFALGRRIADNIIVKEAAA